MRCATSHPGPRFHVSGQPVDEPDSTSLSIVKDEPPTYPALKAHVSLVMECGAFRAGLKRLQPARDASLNLFGSSNGNRRGNLDRRPRGSRLRRLYDRPIRGVSEKRLQHHRIEAMATSV